MLDLLTKELTELGAFDKQLPPLITNLMSTIPNQQLPDRMKAVMVLSEVSTFASQFRRNLWHWDGFELPVNSIAMVIAGSGEGKDSSVKAVRRGFSPAYEIINDKRKAIAKSKAISIAQESGEENATDWEVYKEYYYEPAPIYIAPTTPQGFIQHINDIADLPIGSGTTFAGEFGDELATNGNMLEIIKTLAETYDTGDKEMVYTKGKEHRSKEISSMPISALLMSSPNYIIYDESTKRKFLIAFGSKFARRAFFGFIPEVIPPPSFPSVKARIEDERKRAKIAMSNREAVSKEAVKIANYQLQKGNDTITISEEVFDLFHTYKYYNEAFADTINPKYPLSKLSRRHLQWKALKLAGAFAIFKCKDTLDGEDYLEAIRICELLDSDMELFEAELIKEPYEIFADSMKYLSVDGKSTIGLHDLRKLKYIPTSGDPSKKMLELIHLAAAYDKEATYSVKENEIHYDAIVKTDTIGVSFKPIDNSGIFKAIESGASPEEVNKQKGFVASTANYGLEVGETTFSDLAVLLTKDMAYSPFRFKDGNRSKSNIVGGSKVIALDVDHSNVTAEECHFMIQDINHHIALSSDPNNHFKFRVLIELDSVVDVDPIIWRNFFLAVADDISINVDPLPQSQIFFSYSGRSVLSVTDCEPLPVRNYLMAAMEKAAQPSIANKTYTTTQKQALIDDELVTFEPAFLAAQGEGSRKLIWAAKKAYNDLGMTKDETIALIHRINMYWANSMPEERLNVSIIQQIQRW